MLHWKGEALGEGVGWSSWAGETTCAKDTEAWPGGEHPRRLVSTALKAKAQQTGEHRDGL